MHRMIYKKPFFDLQLQFADRVAEISGLPLSDVLLRYTNLYIRFGLGRDFNPLHPTWGEYLAGLGDVRDRSAWTYRFYLMRVEETAVPEVAATFGCFSYSIMQEERIRLHFQNADREEGSSLSIAYIDQRRADLTALFEHVRGRLPEQTRVVGVSWLYNLEAYRRLFPASYIATARTLTDRFQFMPLWGQFLDRRGELKERVTGPFLECLERTTGIRNLNDCFPFQALNVEGPVGEFYDFYGIEPVGHPPQKQ